MIRRIALLALLGMVGPTDALSSEVLIFRQVGPRSAFRETAPGPAFSVTTSPAEKLGPIKQLSEIGRLLVDVELGAITAGTQSQSLAADPGAAAPVPRDAVGSARITPFERRATSGVGAFTRGLGTPVLRATSRLADALPLLRGSSR